MKQTRKHIQNTFIELCRGKPADKITVKEIVASCQINRNSFYYHFEDLPGLVVSIVEDQVHDAFVAEGGSFTSGFLACARALQDNHDFYRNIYYSKNREILDMRLNAMVEELIRDYFGTRIFDHYDVSEEDQEIIVQTYRMEVGGVFMCWLQEGMRYDLVKRLERMFELRQGTLEMMVQRADRSKRSVNGPAWMQDFGPKTN